MNPLTLATLRCLSASRHVSGESIAAALDVTRATVWNAIREAGAAGVAIERVRGLGYRLAHECTWLDADLIAAALGAQRQRFALEVVPATGSTNSDLLARAAAGAAGGQVIAAEWQAGGRGRRGRGWVNPLGGALTFSLLWRFERGVAALSGLSLVVGLACARALRATGAPDVGVKWPNDLQVDGRKLGGILIELQGDALGPSAAVIGIGLNVRLPEVVLDTVGQPAVDIASSRPDIDRNALLAAVLAQLAEDVDRFDAGGFAPLEAEFRAWHVLQGRPVRVSLPDGHDVDGVVEGTDADGALVVRSGEGVRRFHGGEVSVRGQAW
jgi:BirA family biotin operon repressor/biotin-[acetyl-CoA-carboxylase] ligase